MDSKYTALSPLTLPVSIYLNVVCLSGKQVLRTSARVIVSFSEADGPPDVRVSRYKEAIKLAVTTLKDYVWDDSYSVFAFGACHESLALNEFPLGYSYRSSTKGVEGNCTKMTHYDILILIHRPAYPTVIILPRVIGRCAKRLL